MKICSNCGRGLDDRMQSCDACGASAVVAQGVWAPQAARPFVPKTGLKFNPMLLAIVLLLVGLIVGAGIGIGISGILNQTITTTQTSITDYKAAMGPILSQVGNMASNTSAQATAFSNGQISQADFLAFITTQKDNLGVLLESTIRLHPPQAFAEAHVHVVRAIALLYSAYQLMQDGLTQNNAALITEASTFLNQTTNELNTATSILNSQ